MQANDTTGCDRPSGSTAQDGYRNLTPPEWATVRAALRLYLDAGMGDPLHRPDAIHCLATANDTVISLHQEAIEALLAELAG